MTKKNSLQKPLLMVDIDGTITNHRHFEITEENINFSAIRVLKALRPYFRLVLYTSRPLPQTDLYVLNKITNGLFDDITNIKDKNAIAYIDDRAIPIFDEEDWESVPVILAEHMYHYILKNKKLYEENGIDLSFLSLIEKFRSETKRRWVILVTTKERDAGAWQVFEALQRSGWFCFADYGTNRERLTLFQHMAKELRRRPQVFQITTQKGIKALPSVLDLFGLLSPSEIWYYQKSEKNKIFSKKIGNKIGDRAVYIYDIRGYSPNDIAKIIQEGKENE